MGVWSRKSRGVTWRLGCTDRYSRLKHTLRKALQPSSMKHAVRLAKSQSPARPFPLATVVSSSQDETKLPLMSVVDVHVTRHIMQCRSPHISKDNVIYHRPRPLHACLAPQEGLLPTEKVISKIVTIGPSYRASRGLLLLAVTSSNSISQPSIA